MPPIKRSHSGSDSDYDQNQDQKKAKLEPTQMTVDSNAIDQALGGYDDGAGYDYVGSDEDDDDEDDSDEDDEDDEDDDSDEDDDDDDEEEGDDDEDDDDDYDDDNDRGNKRKTKRKKLTERQTFELKERYRLLDQKLLEQRNELTKETGLNLVTQSLNEVDTLFASTKSTLQSNIMAKDAATLKEIGHQAHLATKNLKLGPSAKELDFDTFVSGFIDRFGVSSDQRYDSGGSGGSAGNVARFNFMAAGLMFNACSRRSVSSDFLLGPLEIVRKVRTVKARVKDDSRKNVSKKANEKTASDLMSEDKKDDTVSNTMRCFKALASVKFAKVNFFKFFIDPHSFGKSVENLFYTSFLINNEKAILGNDEFGIPFIQQANDEVLKKLPHYNLTLNESFKSHIIFNLDHDTWKGLIETYQITDSFLK
ncbi:unnamed protein product [Ambrosiozyma monospora]|uniref:Non-structural maintenance of chromosomes element 4 n=1 Tax=Ambrosiozyma monospora TaxID=43982 RepID=A0A9W7DK61_AMBMO|nr:unnamed protein product [Ambrosiozyma monospora]